MDILRTFLQTLFAWVLFAMGAAWFLTSEQHFAAGTKDFSRPQLFAGPYEGTADLSRLTGVQVLGMIPYALNGEYDLAIEGIGTFDDSTDISAFDLRWVPSYTYRITVTRDADNKVKSVTANRTP
ncbi:hypothetical protein [Paenibacillus puerhi]|uniref:hypothetical protein n=1 Tax=Paenibacillus puerhi TaxID=2692622 RepID=UPI00135C0CA8|nr:hypothetical protein [Paenibacillus puerhi]